MDKQHLNLLIAKVARGEKPVFVLRPRTSGDTRRVRIDRYSGGFFYGVFLDVQGYEPALKVHEHIMANGSFYAEEQ